MHFCEYTGGAWFRSTNPAEEHAFYDPGTSQLYKNNGPLGDLKLLCVANSKRGYFVSVFWDAALPTPTAYIAYSDPSSFWNKQTLGAHINPNVLFHKITRLDLPNVNNEVYFIFFTRFSSATESMDYVDRIRT